MPDGSERDRLELQVQNRLALALMMNGGLVSDRAARACDRAAELAVRLGDTRQLLSSMASLAKAAIVRAEWEVVSSLGAQMLALGEATGSPLSCAAGLFTLGNAELFMGRLRDSRRHIDEAIAIARPLWEQTPEVAVRWVNPLVFALAVVGLGMALSDDEESAAAALREAGDLAYLAGHPFWPVGVHLCAAIRHAWHARPGEALAEAERCIALGQATGLRETVVVAAVIRSWAMLRADPGPTDADATPGRPGRVRRRRRPHVATLPPRPPRRRLLPGASVGGSGGRGRRGPGPVRRQRGAGVRGRAASPTGDSAGGHRPEWRRLRRRASAGRSPSPGSRVRPASFTWRRKPSTGSWRRFPRPARSLVVGPGESSCSRPGDGFRGRGRPSWPAAASPCPAAALADLLEAG